MEKAKKELKMNSKSKMLIEATGIVGVILLTFNYNKMHYFSHIRPELDISVILYGIGLITLCLYFLIRKWRKVISKIIIGLFGISLALNLYIFAEYYKISQKQNRFEEYSELKTCAEMEKRFATDLKNQEIKYFQFGFGYDIKLEKTLKDKYHIESFGMGCSLISKFICYNKLVNEYLKEKHSDKIIDF
ncbi:hypothetical protein [Tenacibaculum sp. M341]|uniref:FEKKY domain-containing protein n=1 Tax=Tenacibaculum sp. M341 TaxID=2530339 RepID=UPI0010523E44|nr:hypothetical protein [Tenacibaculum sp. M341]TCI90605.1 hypothetical protein EYW44_12825 [Tenacibaculum sp. M341]